MSEKYTYGYNIGWNKENNYIESIDSIIEKYNNETKKIMLIVNQFNQNTKDIVTNNRITDDQIKEWYKEDYALNNSLVSFESYKQSILKMINQTNQNLNNELPIKLDEYYANSYYLIGVKNNTRNELNKKKNELELLLSEKTIKLDTVNLGLSKLIPQYNQDGNIINLNEFQVLRDKYDDMWLEIRKIEHALRYLNDAFKIIELKKDEIDLLQVGLTIEQQKIYKGLIFDSESNVENKEKLIPEQDLISENDKIDLKQESKKQQEIREMIEFFKSIKADLTDQDIKEIEGFIKR